MQNLNITYPTAIILLREISNHFGLKNHTGLADQIDEYAMNIYYPHYFEDQYINCLFNQEYFSAQIAQFLIHDTKLCIKEFYNFQKSFSLCGQPTENFQENFINITLSVKVLPFIKQRLLSLGFISKNTKNHFLKEVFLKSKTIKKIDKELQDRIRVWSNLDELPEPQKLKEFSKFFDFKKQDVILSSLLLARALDSCAKYGITETKLTKNLFDDFLLPHCSDADKNIFGEIFTLDLILTQILKLPKKLFANDLLVNPPPDSIAQQSIEGLYAQLPTYVERLNYCGKMANHFLTTIHDYPNIIFFQYIILWAQARYTLFTGELDQSLNLYMSCIEASIKYDARFLELILNEALVVCSLQDKASNDVLRKIANIAIRYNLRMSKIDVNLDELPKRFKLENVFEIWELDVIKAKTFEVFDQELFLENQCSFLNTVPKSSFLTLTDNIRIDLKNPNKKISSASEKKIRMPQLLYCILKRDVEAVKALLEHGASVNELSSSNDSVLTLCLNDNILELGKQQQEILELLLQKEFTAKTLNAVTIKKRLSALHLAVQLGDVQLLNELLKRGCHIDLIADVDEHSALHLALKLLGYSKKNPSFDDFIKATLSHPKQSKLSLYRHSAGSLDLDQVLKNLYSPTGYQIGKEVYEAMQPKVAPNRMREIIHLLLNAGANVNQPAKLPVLGYTPLMLAIESNEYEIARYMIDHCKGDLNKTYVDLRNGRLISAQDIIKHFKSYQCEALLN